MTRVFLSPYGWVSFEPSETQKLCAKIDAAQDRVADRDVSYPFADWRTPEAAGGAEEGSR